MPETRLRITPWGSGNGPVPGTPSYAERVLTDAIVKVWPFQNVIMGLIKRKTVEFQLDHRWPIRGLNARNTTARPWAMNIDELTPTTSEPLELNNTWTCLRFAIMATHVAQLAKRNWVPDLMQEWTEEEIYQIFRGWEHLVTTSSHVAASASNVIPQFAGVGFNTTGTGFDAASGPYWTTSITDTNIRQSQRNAGGAAWDFNFLQAGLRTIRRAGPEVSVCIVGDTNKGIAEEFPHAQQTFDGSATKMEAHRNIDRVRTRYGYVDLHLALLDDFPQQGVLTMDPDSLEFVVPEGLGLQFLDIEPQGDHDQMMAKSMGSLRNLYPHGQDLLANTAA